MLICDNNGFTFDCRNKASSLPGIAFNHDHSPELLWGQSL